MKKQIYLLFLLPGLLSSHIKDERLFKSGNVPSSAMILLDRSGSMGWITIRPYALVRLNEYAPGDHRDRLSGWYDTDMSPDGPGTMRSFNGASADSLWVLHLEWSDWRQSSVVGNWTLGIKSDGVWHTFDGGNFSWTGWWSGEGKDTIIVRGLGTIEDIECYVDISTDMGLEIGEMRINLIHTPALSVSTRIRDALLVIHSLLDANKDGVVTEDDNDYLPVYLGYGFHREDNAYLPNDSYYDEDLGKSYNQYTKKWESAGDGDLYTDSIGSRFVNIWDHINYTDVGGQTPNGVLIARAVDYIRDWENDHSDLWCMKHNIILITDGETNNPREECDAGSKDVVRQAYRAWYEDSIRVYAVGFGTDIADRGANELNWVARWGGTQKEDSVFIDSMVTEGGMDITAIDPKYGCPSQDPGDHFLTGYAYIAESIEELSSALAKIFMTIVKQKNLSFATGEVTSVEEEFLSTEYQTRLYFASFNPNSSPIWFGDLKAVKLTEGEFNLDSIPSDLIVWSAGDSLDVDQSADERNIYGIKTNGDMLPFNEANFDTADLDVTSSTMATDVIDRVRDGIENDNKGELGDIFHSSPLRIHSPNYFFIDQGFDQFYTQMKDRSPLLYVGANDGMLHIFADSIIGESGRGGEEIMGIIPMNFVPKVKELLSTHEYFVDADPVAADIWFPTDGNDSLKQWDEWHTVLMATQGEGGRSFTVVDATDPLGETQHSVNSLEFLFSAMQSSLLQDTLGYTTSTPIIRKVGINWTGHPKRTIDRFYAFMGGGQWPEPMDLSLLDSVFSGGNVEGNVIIAIDLWKANDEGISGNVNLIPPIGRDAGRMTAPFPATPSMVNTDPEKGNRYDCLFIPDAYGQLWFVDLTNPDPSTWKAECIFVPPLPASSDSSELIKWHPAFYRPLVWKDPVYGDYWVAYGTGNRSDIFSPSEDRFYTLKYPAEAIEDTTVAIPVYSEGDLGYPDNPKDAGWMLTLSHANEKVVTKTVYYLDSLKFFTFSPGADPTLSPCGICDFGETYSYTFNIRTGGNEVVAGTQEGAGLPQPPQYSYSLSGTVMQLNQISGKIIIKKGKSFKSFKKVIRWSEK